MNKNAYDWVGAKGEKWRAHLGGMEAMLSPIDAPLIRTLALDAPCRIADVGCGGGSTTLEILQRAPAGSVVHGFDVSPTLIEVARARVPPGTSVLEFDVADVATAGPPGAPYHRLVSRFGVMFFDDPQQAFANLTRWLVPGGRFAFAVWGDPNANLCLQSVRDVVAEVVPLPVTDPEAPNPFRYAEPSKFVALLERAGFAELEVREWREPLPVGGALSASEAATFALASLSTYAELLANVSEEVRREVHASVQARFAAHERDGAVWMDAFVQLVTGIRA